MFRFQDNLPEVYLNESRDFQLFSRLSDVLFSGAKYDIDSMINILDTLNIKDNLLQLLCTKLGFFPSIEIDTQVLKYIIASFPYIVKNKGNKLGVEYAINAILKSEQFFGDTPTPKIIMNSIMDKTKNIPNSQDNYCSIHIYLEQKIQNQKVLKEIMKYALPTGYSYKIIYSKDLFDGYDNPVIIKQTDKVHILEVNANHYDGTVPNTAIRIPNTNYGEDDKKARRERFIGAFDTMEIKIPPSANIEPKENAASKNEE